MHKKRSGMDYSRFENLLKMNNTTVYRVSKATGIPGSTFTDWKNGRSYPKSDKLETIIQKAVELGVSAVTPFESERCIKRPKADKVAHVTERHNRIAKEAAGQSGRDRLPTVHSPISFAEMLKEASRFPLCLFCYEGSGTHSLKEICANHPDVREIAVVVGSEGGFSEREAEAAAAAGLAIAAEVVKDLIG